MIDTFTIQDMVGHAYYHGAEMTSVNGECLGEQCSFIRSPETREFVRQIMAKTRAQREYDRERKALDAAMDACAYCKRARQRAKDGCRKHVSQRRLIYVTSPISETYWSS